MSTTIVGDDGTGPAVRAGTRHVGDETIDPILSARVYLVDDQPANLRLLERFLGRAGFEDVHSFSDPRAALAAIETSEPDLLLLDLHMPGLDGFGVLAALRELIPEDDFVPILVLTGDVDREARSRALTGGATDFLIKPFDVEEVVLRTRNLIRTRQLHAVVRARNLELTTKVRTTSDALVEVEAHWRSVAQGLARLTGAESAEATASAVCAELATLPDLAGVALFAFGVGGIVVPLALSVPIEFGLAVNVPIPTGHSTMLRRQAAKGTWVESLSIKRSVGTYRRPLVEAGFTAAAFVPLRSESATLGLLAAGGTGFDAADRLAGRVPALEAFASIASALLAPGIEERQRDDTVRFNVRRSIEEQAFTPVFQPIVDLATATTVGYEALTRFADGVRPDRRFAEAAAVGLGLELEVATLTAAIAAARELPGDGFLSLNVSPQLVLEGNRLAGLLLGASAPVVLEITEHAPVDDYPALRGAIDRLGSSVRFAADDAGAGYSSFRHIVELRPDFVKLDIGLVRAIGQDPVRRAFVAGLVHFAQETGYILIAEGVETREERTALQALTVGLGQGYLFGRPAPARAYAGARAAVSAGAGIASKARLGRPPRPVGGPTVPA
ncbi:MAG: EAL domain-containing protein [Chloroflexota bacterium]